MEYDNSDYVTVIKMEDSDPGKNVFIVVHSFSNTSYDWMLGFNYIF